VKTPLKVAYMNIDYVILCMEFFLRFQAGGRKNDQTCIWFLGFSLFYIFSKFRENSPITDNKQTKTQTNKQSTVPHPTPAPM